MSIAALQETSKELRRLAIAGSGLAKDDFRLKKLIPPLRESGAKVPVFARVADSLEELVGAGEADSATVLLQTATLVNAILYTQLNNKIAGDAEPIPHHALKGDFEYRPAMETVAVAERLLLKGSGRHEAIQEAKKAGVFTDLRLFYPAMEGLGGTSADIAELILREVIPLYGEYVVSIARQRYTGDGGAYDRRMLRLIGTLAKPEISRPIVRAALESKLADVRELAVELVALDPEGRHLVRSMVKDRADGVRRAAIKSLRYDNSREALETLLAGLQGNDAYAAGLGLRYWHDGSLAARELEVLIGRYAEDTLKRTEGFSIENLMEMIRVREALPLKEKIPACINKLFGELDQWEQVEGTKTCAYTGIHLASQVWDWLYKQKDKRTPIAYHKRTR
jgi:hypothetical protein